MKGKNVLVTGATGFVGSLLCKQLVLKEYAVHSTVRSMQSHKLKPFSQIPNHNIKFFQLSLQSPQEQWEEVFSTNKIDTFFHVASPVNDNDYHIVKKATQNIINAAHKAKVSHTIITSTLATAISRNKVKKTYSENDFGEKDQAIDEYAKSKIEQEAVAWDYFRKNKKSSDRMKLTTIHPSFVVGPSLVQTASAGALMELLDNKFGKYLELYMPIVDVRDVVDSHIKAMENSDLANGKRYFCSYDECISMKDLSFYLSKFEKYGFSVAKEPMSPYLVKLIGLMSPDFYNHIKIYEKKIFVDNSRISQELGIKFRSPLEGIDEMVYQILRTGKLKEGKFE